MGFVDSRLFAKVERLAQQLNQAQFDSHIGICTFLNQTVRQERTPQFSIPLASMVSAVDASMVTVSFCPGFGGSGEILRDFMVTISSEVPTRRRLV